MTNHTIHQRSACDRCRKQKLRCPRLDDNRTDTCQRCERAGVQCTTGEARPIGRPYNRPQGHARRGQSAEQSPSAPPPAPAPHIFDTLPTIDQPLDFGDLFGFPSPGTSDFTSFDWAAGFNSCSGSDGTSTGTSTGTSINSDTLFHSSPSITSTSTPAASEPLSHPTIITTPLEATLALSSLSASFASQLSKLHTHPWHDPIQLQRNCAAELASPTGNPVAEMLSSTTSFVSLVKSLTSSVLDPPSRLLLLVAYLQLLRVYATLFGRMVKFLEKTPEEATVGVFVPSRSDLGMGAGIAGLSGVGVSPFMWIRMLVQVICHQIETVEERLGLEGEFRVSGGGREGRGGREGIFGGGGHGGDEGGKRLVEMVMGMGEGEETGRELVGSIRESLARAGEMLRGR